MLVLVASSPWDRAGAAEPWHASYLEAERLIEAGEWRAAEAALRAALEDRPDSGCHLRTYGIKYRDYIPLYYLGVAQAEQGKLADAAASFERAAQEGVVERCAGTQRQALDLRERLARAATPAAVPAAPSASLADIEGLRAEVALEGATELAPDLLAKADAALGRARSGDRAALDEARAALGAARSRVRTDGPLVALLRREAEEAVERARLFEQRIAGEGVGSRSFDEGRVLLREAEALLARGRSAELSLATESHAERAARLFEQSDHARTLAAREKRARMEADVRLTLALAQAARDAAPDMAHEGRERVNRASAWMQRAQGLLGGSERDLAVALDLARRARAELSEMATRRVPAAPSPDGDRRRVVHLAWSAGMTAPEARLPATAVPAPKP